MLYLSNISFPNVQYLSINLIRNKTTHRSKLINLLPRQDLKAIGKGLSQTASPIPKAAVSYFELVYQLPTCVRLLGSRSSVKEGKEDNLQLSKSKGDTVGSLGSCQTRVPGRMENKYRKRPQKKRYRIHGGKHIFHSFSNTMEY